MLLGAGCAIRELGQNATTDCATGNIADARPIGT
jgi:hypothetical protein